MPETELARIEVGFQGGDVLAVRVPVPEADRLEAALRKREDTVCELNAEDGRFIVALERVVYVKRYAREARVGFTR